MSLRERLRRAVYELVKPEEETPRAEAPKTTTTLPPLPPELRSAEEQRLIQMILNPKPYRPPLPKHPSKCCYCRNDLAVYVLEKKFKGIQTYHTILEEGGHVMCGRCFLSPGYKWPCRKDHD